MIAADGNKICSLHKENLVRVWTVQMTLAARGECHVKNDVVSKIP